jgi:hypothetical protein
MSQRELQLDGNGLQGAVPNFTLNPIGKRGGLALPDISDPNPSAAQG